MPIQLHKRLMEYIDRKYDEKPSFFLEVVRSFFYRAPSMEKCDAEWSGREPSTKIHGDIAIQGPGKATDESSLKGLRRKL